MFEVEDKALTKALRPRTSMGCAESSTEVNMADRVSRTGLQKMRTRGSGGPDDIGPCWPG